MLETGSVILSGYQQPELHRNRPKPAATALGHSPSLPTHVVALIARHLTGLSVIALTTVLYLHGGGQRSNHRLLVPARNSMRLYSLGA